MSGEVYCGPLLHQRNSGIGKKWSKRIGYLFERSSQGIKRLELIDAKEKSGKEHVINLEKSTKMIPEKIMDGKKTLHILRIMIQDEKLPVVLAWEKPEDSQTWALKLSAVLFGVDDSSSNQAAYEVEIKPSELTERLNLKGTYFLYVTVENIELWNKQSFTSVMKWPLHYLRKYGRDKQVFSLEAGRRCPSGEGMFYFITDQYNAIFEEVGKNVVALATRGRSTSTSTVSHLPSNFLATRSTSIPSPPDSPRAPLPAPTRKSVVYDNPLDARNEISKQQTPEDAYSYDEPITHKSPKLRKKTLLKKEENQNNMKQSRLKIPFRQDNKNLSRTSTTSPTFPLNFDPESAYSVAFDVETTDPSSAYLTSDYSKLTISEGGSSKPSAAADISAVAAAAYDSLTWESCASPPVANEPEYATASDCDNQYATAMATSYKRTSNYDTTYDHVQR